MPPQRHFGWRHSPPDHRDHLYAAPAEVVAALPPKFELTIPPLGSPFDPAMDQGNLGSCGPNSAAANLVLVQMKAVGAAVMPSRMFIYYATRQIMGTTAYDSGVYNRDLLKSLNKFGWPDETLWPYEISKYKTKPPASIWGAAATRKITQYLSVAQNLNTIKSSLAENCPIIFGFTVYSSFLSDEVESTGAVPMPSTSEAVQGGHDVLLTGWDDETQRFRFRNSWGSSWGNNGDGSIPYAYALSSRLSGDFWTVRAAGVAPPVPPAPPGQFKIVVPTAIPAGTYLLNQGGQLIPAPVPEPPATASRQRRRRA